MKKIVFILLMIYTGMGYGWCDINMDDNNTHETHKKAKLTKADRERISQTKKLLDQARTNIKKGSNLESTEKQLRDLLNDTVNHRQMQARVLLCEAIAKQYEIGNEKLFLKEKYDTAALFTIAQRMFIAYNELDSVDAIPDQRGIAQLRYRKNNASLLAPFHKNLYSGGIFFLNHKKYSEAWSIIDTYLSAYQWPLFSSEKLNKDAIVISHAAYVSLISAYLNNDYGKALKYEKESLTYSPKRENIIECISDIYLQKNEDAKYEEYLRMGVKEYPESSYFFPHLIDYYSNNGMSDKAMRVVDELIDKDTVNILYMSVKQLLLLNKGRYDECIDLGDKILSMSDSVADAYYNIALAIYNKALLIEDNNSIKPREKKKQMNILYKKCCPYIEKYRAMKPEEKEKWLPILYAIYLNLNMGKEFDEILRIK